MRKDLNQNEPSTMLKIVGKYDSVSCKDFGFDYLIVNCQLSIVNCFNTRRRINNGRAICSWEKSSSRTIEI